MTIVKIETDEGECVVRCGGYGVWFKSPRSRVEEFLTVRQAKAMALALRMAAEECNE